MKHFKSKDSYELKDRGTVYIVEADQDYTRGEDNLVGEKISIDGWGYIVKGMEFMGNRNKKGDNIGLLVKPDYEVIDVFFDCKNSAPPEMQDWNQDFGRNNETT